MHVASKELCEELFGLSKWWTDEPDGFTWLKDDINGGGKWEIICNHSFQPMPSVLYRKGDKAYPAYDLGYLLRKLPKNYRWMDFSKNTDKWEMLCDIEADTPEDAACKLAIELIKHGILTPELSSKEKEKQS